MIETVTKSQRRGRRAAGKSRRAARPSRQGSGGSGLGAGPRPSTLNPQPSRDPRLATLDLTGGTFAADKVPPGWRKLLLRIPGYDCFRDAAGCVFDADEAKLRIGFVHDCIRHGIGTFEGKPFILELWQQAIVANLFGWKRSDGSRRYRKTFWLIPRGCGKTPLAVAAMLSVFFQDGEAGQECFLSARDREQAGIAFRMMAANIRGEEMMAEQVRIYEAKSAGGAGIRSIFRERDNSFIKVVSADAPGKHGGTPSVVLVDEVHAQPDGDLISAFETGMQKLARRQPLLILISTADFERVSICNDEHDYARKVRDGGIAAPACLPVIYEVEPPQPRDGEKIDQLWWTNEKIWAHANPNLDVTVSREGLREQAKAAIEQPNKLGDFLRLHLNVRTGQRTQWLNMVRWAACGGAIDPASLVGRSCFAAMDLASKIDMNAAGLLFPPVDAGERWKFLSHFWLPEKRIETRKEPRMRAQLETWARQGHLTLIPGDIMEQNEIKAKVLEWRGLYNIVQLAYDPWNATKLALELQAEGIEVIEYRQGMISMNEPSKELERMVLADPPQLGHGDQPVLTWHASNVEVDTDSKGNICPRKPAHAADNKIDGIIALVMCLGLAIVAGEQSATAGGCEVW